MPEGVSSCRFVKKYPERKRDRILSDDEYRRLATALGTPSAGSFALAVAIAATRLLMLAECGNGEVLSLRREEVALERSELRLCDAKTEAKAVHRRDEQPVRETHRFGLCLGGGGQDVRTGRRCAGGIVTRLPCPHSCTSPSCTGTAFARGAPSDSCARGLRGRANTTVRLALLPRQRERTGYAALLENAKTTKADGSLYTLAQIGRPTGPRPEGTHCNDFEETGRCRLLT